MVLYNNCYVIFQNHNILHLLHVNKVHCVSDNLYFILEVWSLQQS